MGKPQYIVLIRHGQSEGNVNQEIYAHTPDYAVLLTEQGKKEARNAGTQLKRLVGDVPIQFYVSPYFRTRQTYQEISSQFSQTTLREDPRLREQEWAGRLDHSRNREKQHHTERERDLYGTFYYRFDGGESCADVYDRVSSFLDTLHRDFEKPHFPSVCTIISHGMTLRVFLLRWFNQMTIEQFELMANPINCCRIVMELHQGKYRLLEDPELLEKGIITKLELHAEPKHPYRLPI